MFAIVEIMAAVGVVAGALLAVVSLGASVSRTERGKKLRGWIRQGYDQDRRQLIAEVIEDVMPRYLAPLHRQLLDLSDQLEASHSGSRGPSNN